MFFCMCLGAGCVWGGVQMILEEDIATWPRVDCLICFFSTGFPLEKAIDYVKRFRPILLNDLEQQKIIRDRVLVYEQLKVRLVFDVGCQAMAP